MEYDQDKKSIVARNSEGSETSTVWIPSASCELTRLGMDTCYRISGNTIEVFFTQSNRQFATDISFGGVYRSADTSYSIPSVLIPENKKVTIQNVSVTVIRNDNKPVWS